MNKITEKEFDEKYTPQINHIVRALTEIDIADEEICSFSGCMYETFGAEMKYVLKMVKENRVVTILEGGETEPDEHGDTHSIIYYASGYHLVDRLGFFVLDKPYTEEFEVTLDW